MSDLLSVQVYLTLRHFTCDAVYSYSLLLALLKYYITLLVINMHVICVHLFTKFSRWLVCSSCAHVHLKFFGLPGNEAMMVINPVLAL